MQPLVPFLLGKPYFIEGKEVKRLVNVQKCVRTIDIDSIGDKTHATFFEMLGNWSLGDYFKKEAINWSYEFLTNQTDAPEGDQGLGLDPKRLYVTVFEGDENAPRDLEAADIWGEIFKKNGIDVGGDTANGESGRIFFMPAENNWWQAGENGPCGPDTEMFYDVTNKFGGRTLTHDEYVKADEVRDVVEIWNDVFMQYVKEDGKVVGKLPKPSVDTGAGLERLAMTLQGVDNIYETDLLQPVMEKIKSFSKNWNENDEKSSRIIADHLRTSVFLIADGVSPSNTDRGYVLRRLLRRAILNASMLHLQDLSLNSLVSIIASIYTESYPVLTKKSADIGEQIRLEEEKFKKTVNASLETLQKALKNETKLDGKFFFDLYQTFGLPPELAYEEISARKSPLSRKDWEIIMTDFAKLMSAHQSLSRAGAEQKFKGGLADNEDPMIIRYHTATHLLHQALHDVLGESEGNQKGSNITPERLRFDFTGSKLTDEQKKRIEDIVNEKIQAKLPVKQITMPLEEAEKTGARHLFGEKYGEKISIYFIGNDLNSAYSKEFCGGPHVTNTSELAGPEGKWRFKIAKEEAVSQGVRRIKAVLG